MKKKLLFTFLIFTLIFTLVSCEDAKKEYTVTYDGNGSTSGSVPVDTNKYDSDSKFVLPECGDLKMDRDGFTWKFIGWGKASDDADPKMPGEELGMPEHDITIYALWSPFMCTGPAGGTIIYIKEEYSGNPSWRYLEIAPSVTATSVPWALTNTDIGTSSADDYTAGAGISDTKLIVQDQGNGGSYAAKICDDLELNGYSDWFLPSSGDFTLCDIRSVIYSIYFGNMSLSGEYLFKIWLSSETSDSTASACEISSETTGIYYKPYGKTEESDKCDVIAVRAF